MSRVHNFSAGPAALPEAVLEQIRSDLPDWAGTGMSVMEISHRSKEFIALAEQAEQDVRDLLAIPDDYAVLFLQGGATLQFAMTALNLSQPGDTADFVVTGHWGKKAVKEAGKFCTVNIAADAEDSGYNHIPRRVRVAKDRRGGLSALHTERNDRRCGVWLHSRFGERSAGCRHVQHDSLATVRCLPLRRHLRRCAKEHRTRRNHARDRSQ